MLSVPGCTPVILPLRRQIQRAYPQRQQGWAYQPALGSAERLGLKRRKRIKNNPFTDVLSLHTGSRIHKNAHAHKHAYTYGQHIHTCMHKRLQPYSHMHAYTHMNTFTSTMHTTDTHTCTSIPTRLYINQHYKHDTHTHIPHRYARIHTHKCTAWYFSLELDLFVLYMYGVNLISKSVLRD